MTIRNWAVLVVVGFCAACSSSSGGGGNGTGGLPNNNPTGGKSFCETACQKVNQCDGSEDLQTCSADCNNSMAVIAPKLRSEYVAKLSSCFAAKDCATVLNGDADSACAAEAAASLAPTQAGTNFCNGLSAAAQKCDGSIDMAGCLGAAKQYSDATLLAAQTCFSKSCSDIDACVNAQLGIQETSQPSGDNSCQYSYDGVCDEPEYCEYGTDSYDCS